VSPSALAWRAALAACLLVLGLGPSAGLAQDSDAARIKTLEAEVRNLKLMVATLQSLVRTAPGTALAPDGSAAAVPSDLEPRVRALDTQIGALTNQVEQMGQRVRALEVKLDAKLDAAPEAAKLGVLTSQVEQMGQRVSALQSKLEAQLNAAPEPSNPGDLSDEVDTLGKKMSALETKLAATPGPATIATLTGQINALDKKMSALEAKLDATPKTAPALTHATPAPQAEADKEAVPEGAETAKAEPTPIVPEAVPPAPEEPFDPNKPRWYGPRSGELTGTPQSIAPPATTGALPQSFAALPNENAQALYDQGYGDFLQSNYAAAEKSFSKLVETYPKDPLAGSAQYWVGETYYVRKQYKKAADTFLAGYRKYSGSDKAPDTLLRLGMSLAALGQNEAACSTFKELKDKFPDAPANIRDQAKGEAGKAGCVQ
jgi:tol-pal system protein YbgF